MLSMKIAVFDTDNFKNRSSKLLLELDLLGHVLQSLKHLAFTGRLSGQADLDALKERRL